MEGEKCNGETIPIKKEEGGSPPSRGTFKTKFGIVFSLLGCMVGTGNIWRFPRIAANNSGETGCLQFLLVWVLFLFLWSIPMLVIEYSLGRYTKLGPVSAYKKLLGPRSAWCGGWILVVDIGIASYYSVILGWCFYYLYYFLAHPLPSTDWESQAIFDSFVRDSSWPVLTHVFSILLAGASLMWGVRSIELVNSILVPLFLALLIFSVIYSFTLEYAGEGLKFLFSPDWGEFLNPKLWVDAASQNAFDTGAGMGLMISYSVFLTQDNGIVRYASLIPIGNNLVSLCCGMMMFSTVFAVQTQNGYNQTDIINLLRDDGEANTGLTFTWIPVLYDSISIGRGLAVIFFLALSFAGLSSLVANFELAVKTLEDFNVKRKFGVVVVMVVTFIIGLGSSLNLNFLINQDFVWGFALIISGAILQYLVIRYGTAAYRDTFINSYGTNDWYLPKLWEWMVKFLAPLEAVVLILWFAIDQIITSPNEWYALGTETLMSCVLVWVGSILILNVVNALWLYWHVRRHGASAAAADLSKPDESNNLGNATISYNTLKEDLEN